ncbi:conserved hypothetical protein [Nitrospira lenta]|uniref:Uncharacterized protein n=1 Tax=Nitrospira lenta TaxID=1436998 RepID=A0A330LAE5_9BACT|nr:conserved hypothetical protein [Nitrospira lenta]
MDSPIRRSDPAISSTPSLNSFLLISALLFSPIHPVLTPPLYFAHSAIRADPLNFSEAQDENS